MKRHGYSFFALLPLCLLVACSWLGAGDTLSSNSSGNSRATYSHYDFELSEFYSANMSDFVVPPTICQNEVLASAPARSNMASGNTLVDLATGTEKAVDLPASDPQLDAKYYYWHQFVHEENAVQFWRESRQDGSRELLLQLDNEVHNVTMRLSLGKEHLVWCEAAPLEGGWVDWKLYALNCNTKQVKELGSTSLHSQFTRFKVRNGYIAYVVTGGDTSTIKVVDVTDGTVKHEEDIAGDVQNFVSDGNLLVYSTPSGVQITNIGMPNKGASIQVKEAVDVDVLLSRFVVFAADFQLYIYDLVENKQVFTTQNDEGVAYLNFFDADENAGRVVVEGWKGNHEEEGYFMAILSVSQAVPD